MEKQEIALKHGLMIHDPIQGYHIARAMEEYASQEKRIESIGFAEWAGKLYVRIEKDDAGNMWVEKLFGRYYTTEQLYEIYKKL